GTNSLSPQEVEIPALDEFHPALHGVPVLLDHGFVAILDPGGPGDDHSGISPSGRADHAFVPRLRAYGFSSFGGKRVRRNVGECALTGLRVNDVLNELL